MEHSKDHRRRLLALVQSEPPAKDDPSGLPGVLRRLCTAVTRELPATWAGISLVEVGEIGGTITGSDRQARDLEDLQFDLGEGPCVDAVRTRRPVFETDLTNSGFGRWPAYAPEAYQLGARAVFAFPLQTGAVCVGALDVYQARAAPMAVDAVSSALWFAHLAMDMMVGGQPDAPAGRVERDLSEALAPRLEVYQAQGMVMVDLAISLEEAMERLRAHAFAVGRPLSEVARDVVAGRLRLEL